MDRGRFDRLMGGWVGGWIEGRKYGWVGGRKEGWMEDKTGVGCGVKIPFNGETQRASKRVRQGECWPLPVT